MSGAAARTGNGNKKKERELEEIMGKLELHRKRSNKKGKACNIMRIVVNFMVNRSVSRRRNTIRMFTYKKSS